MANNNILLNDVAGYQEEKEEAKKIINFLSNFDKYKKLGAYVPKGLILSGPPGVGKTLLSQAIANESNVPFYQLNTTDSINDATTIKRIKAIFKEAKEHSPSIIFIDEIDDLISTDDFRTDFSRVLLQTILTELDGVTTSEGIMVIATTNNVQSLPLPMIRSGRMDKSIKIELPNAETRDEIFKYYLDKYNIKDIDSKKLAVKTSGFSGADIKNCVNEVVINNVTCNVDNIKIDDFEKVIPEILFKDIKRKNNEKSKEVIAYHEAGHLLCEYLQTGKVGSLTVEKVGKIMGRFDMEVEFISVDFNITKKNLNSKLITYLGGLAAEEVFYGDVTIGSTNDLNDARRIIHMVMDTGAFGFDFYVGTEFSPMTKAVGISNEKKVRIENLEASLLTDAYNKAKELLEKNQELMLILSERLRNEEKLSKEEVGKIIEDNKHLIVK